MKSLGITAIVLFSLAAAHARDACTNETFDRRCRALANLRQDDMIVLPSGFRVPACATDLGVARYQPGDVERYRVGLGLVSEAISMARANSGSTPPSVSLIDSVFEQGYQRTFRLQRTTNLLWPPNEPVASRTRQSVTPAQARDFWISAVGREGYDKLLQAQAEFERSNAWRAGFAGPRFDMTGQTERRQRLFDQAKDAAIRRILRGREESTLSAGERRMLANVRRTRLAPTPIPNEMSCADPSTSFFTPLSGQITVPAETMVFPDEALLRLMLHEIGHSIDLCQMVPLNDTAFFEHPMQDVIACIQSPAGGGFRTPVSETGRVLKACGNGHAKEAFCDWFAVDVAANDPQLQALTGGEAPRLLPTATPPREVRSPPIANADFFFFDNGCADRDDGDTHPSGRRRTVDIAWRQPLFATQANCTPNGPPCTLETSGRAPSSRSNSTTSPSAPSSN